MTASLASRRCLFASRAAVLVLAIVSAYFTLVRLVYISSLAVFSRAAGGGFMRSAAFGWPPGSAWHLLPEEELTPRLDDGGAAIVRVPEDGDDLALPVDDARPQFALAVRRGDRVERAILVGPQRNGGSLDRDAMRSLHGVFDEAIFV